MAICPGDKKSGNIFAQTIVSVKLKDIYEFNEIAAASMPTVSAISVITMSVAPMPTSAAGNRQNDQYQNNTKDHYLYRFNTYFPLLRINLFHF